MIYFLLVHVTTTRSSWIFFASRQALWWCHMPPPISILNSNQVSTHNPPPPQISKVYLVVSRSKPQTPLKEAYRPHLLYDLETCHRLSLIAWSLCPPVWEKLVREPSSGDSPQQATKHWGAYFASHLGPHWFSIYSLVLYYFLTFLHACSFLFNKLV